ncbi:uncharacterized protein EV154DRAFT_483127 [Mucor mucedo]|uniref:uncharacterized protein n=1 Tax=Mucor mucedo TaxID=29922 RepID=UPI002220584D|nr:uncharacterized protein EV154DRAFT_483127 [Mucor mucedo]KAI7889397.1 hypothetical protein EV154DRAFT_483127 [Mucor mucedo]
MLLELALENYTIGFRPNNYCLDMLRYQDYFYSQTQNTLYVKGNWSAPNTRYHEPVRSLGFRRLLQKVGKRVYLIDEFRTSQCCPAFERRNLETLRMIDNPRLTDEEKILAAMTNNTNGIVPRIWNCDMAACLNIVDIVRTLRAENGILPRFRRGEVPQN